MTDRTPTGRSGPSGIPRSLVSLVALVALVVAVPVVLVAAGGNPLPRGRWHQLHVLFSAHQGFDAHLASRWMVDGALVVGWLTWAWLVVCVVIEVVSWATGKTPARLPGSRTMQSVAACLVGTSLALVAINRVLPAPTARHAATREQVGTLHVIEEFRPVDAASPAQGSAAIGTLANQVPVEGVGPGGEETPHVVTEQPRSMVEEREVVADAIALHTVSARETLWSIAEARLGTARRWKEIADLNYRSRQADGGMLTDTHWIQPGWTLRLPVDATPGPTTVSGLRGDPVPLDGRVTTSAALPSSTPAPVATSAAVPSEMADVSPVTRVQWEPVSSQGARSVSGEPASSHGARSVAGTPIELVGAGLLGAGLVVIVDRMRRAQQRHRRRGTLIRLPDPAGSAIEARIRAGSGRSTSQAIDRALQLFVSSVPGRDRRAPGLLGIQAHPEAIELLLARPADVGPIPPPFALRGDHPSLFLDRSTLDEHLRSEPGVPDGERRCPFPAVVTVGNGRDGPTLVNLELLGSLALRGDEQACDGLVRALALELATSPWAGQFDLVLIGFGHELERFERVEVVDDPAQQLHRLHERRFCADRLLGAAGYRSFGDARFFEESDAWDPLIVVCGPRVPREERSELVAIGSDPRAGVAVVVAGPDATARQVMDLPAGGRSTSLDWLGALVFPQQVTVQELREVTSLVAVAEDREPVSPLDPPYDQLPIPMPRLSERALHPAVDPDAEAAPGGIRSTSREARPVAADGDHTASVEVAVLGPVEIRGAARPFTRAWARELVVYLAMHPNGASNDSWATALWPERVMAASSLHSTASVARRALGHAGDGHDHLPRSHGRLQLATSVGTDWSRFVELASTDDPAQWRLALELVRGRPFDGLRACDWPILEGIAPAIEAAVVDLAGRLAGARLSQGDPSGAEWAARKGLLVSPYDERLYRMLLRSADAAGHPAGVESVMAELIRLVADDVEPYDSVHPATMELYRSLSRRSSLVGLSS